MIALRLAFRLLTTALVLCVSSAASAADQPAPFAHADAAAGRTLVERDCVACHTQKFSGDADRIYLRSDRRVQTPQQLLAQVSWCNTQLGTKYFPDDEENVAAYLNQRYYHFRP